MIFLPLISHTQIPSELITLDPDSINKISCGNGQLAQDEEEEEHKDKKDKKAKKLKKKTRGKGTLTKRLHSRQKTRDEEIRVRMAWADLFVFR